MPLRPDSVPVVMAVPMAVPMTVPMEEVHKAAILAARTLIEKDPGYTRATARLLLHTIRREILGEEVSQAQMAERYAEYFPRFIKKGVEAELLDGKLLQFDLARLGAALDASRDLQFDYLGLQTLYDRYFLHVRKSRIELPQAFFMRVAMGLALNEIDREARAIEFYEVLSSFDFMSSTPTLFNSGTLRSQLSSCYLTTVPDDLDGIYQAIKENAMLQKFAGGIGAEQPHLAAQRIESEALAVGLVELALAHNHPVRRGVPLPGRRPGRACPVGPVSRHPPARGIRPAAVRMERRQRRRDRRRGEGEDQRRHDRRQDVGQGGPHHDAPGQAREFPHGARRLRRPARRPGRPRRAAHRPVDLLHAGAAAQDVGSPSEVGVGRRHVVQARRSCFF